MRQILLTTCLVVTCAFVQGQIRDSVAYSEYHNAPKDQRKFPSYSGNENELKRFLNENLNMSIVANPKLKKGLVKVACQIDTSGVVKYSLNPYNNKKVDNEIMRVFNLMTQWVPGEYLKDDSWVKVASQLMVLISIPYNPDGIKFYYF